MDNYNKNMTIAVAMSGGVDSSTVAYLLKKEGYNIFGITMKTCKDEDKDAKQVCEDLGIPHYLFDATVDFKEDVIDKFVTDYLEGRTPNPCMICNRDMKFGKFLEFAKSHGADVLATGHYAQIKDGTLAMGDDPKKDQVYFLSQIKKENLKHIIFPIGDMDKSDVRVLAKELGVRVYAKKDSQEICFVDDGMLPEFLIERSQGKASNPGDIVDQSGKVLGKHKGISFYTIGQRKGLGIASETPLYVVELDSKKNQVIVGSNEALFKNRIKARDINLLVGENIKELETMELFVKTRSRDLPHPCIVKVVGEIYLEITLVNEDRVRAVTPGQGVVLYDSSNRVIASGFIV